MVGIALGGITRRLKREFATLTLITSADILHWFNREILALDIDQHITMFIGILDDKQNILQYSNAAHFPGAILKTRNSEKNEIVYLEMGGLPLGMCETKYGYQSVKLPKSFDLTLFSDGVLEIMHQASIKDKEEHLLSLVELASTDIETLTARLGLDELGDAPGDVPDDIAIFTVARE